MSDELVTITTGFFTRVTTRRALHEEGARRARIKRGYLYLFQIKGTDQYKIGTTKNIDTRIQAIHNMQPNGIEVVYHSHDQVLNNYQKEAALHSKYANYQVKGEWFCFPPALVPDVVRDFITLEHEGEIDG